MTQEKKSEEELRAIIGASRKQRFLALCESQELSLTDGVKRAIDEYLARNEPKGGKG